MIRVIVSILALLIAGLVGFSFYVSQPVVEGDRPAFTPMIADPSKAWTFARTADALVLVTAHHGDSVEGFNLTEIFGEAQTADLVEFSEDLGQVALPDSAQTHTLSLSDLVAPVQYVHPSIAAGTNFKEHADEIYSEEPPFLFPKLTLPGNWNDPVNHVDRLDYEAELCMFPLQDIDSPDELPGFGLVLCNDFTDRWTLVSEIDLGQPLGTTGFPNGKGCETCFPTGYLVVIPRSPEFYKSLELFLSVNDKLRQKFRMQEMILSIEEIITQAFEVQDADYIKGDEVIRLMPHGKILKGTLILTGTAAGVMFRPSNLWNQGFYLQPGDVVWTEASYLGHLENRIQ